MPLPPDVKAAAQVLQYGSPSAPLPVASSHVGASLGSGGEGMLLDPMEVSGVGVVDAEVLALVPLFESPGEPGQLFCGGLIGKSGAVFCTNHLAVGMVHCGVAAHGKHKVVASADDLFIRRPSSKQRSLGGAFCTPSINKFGLLEEVSSTLEVPRPVSLWTSIFQSIVNGETDSSHITKLDSGASFQKTLFAKRLRPNDPTIDRSATSVTTKQPKSAADGVAIPKERPAADLQDGIDLKTVVEDQLNPAILALWSVSTAVLDIEDALHTLTESTSEAFTDTDNRGSQLQSSLSVLPSTSHGLEAAQVWPNLFTISSLLKDQLGHFMDLESHSTELHCTGSKGLTKISEAHAHLKSHVDEYHSCFDAINIIVGSLYARMEGSNATTSEENVWKAINKLESQAGDNSPFIPDPLEAGRLEALKQYQHKIE